MKYKLIKEYPGSPKLGYIYNPEHFEECCDYTEFWQEVKDLTTNVYISSLIWKDL